MTAEQTTRPVTEIKREFVVHFEFTTMHPKSMFIGRSGSVNIESTNMTKEQMEADTEGLIQFCVNYVLSEKPKWKIFMLSIKSIQEIVPSTS